MDICNKMILNSLYTCFKYFVNINFHKLLKGKKQSLCFDNLSGRFSLVKHIKLIPHLFGTSYNLQLFCKQLFTSSDTFMADMHLTRWSYTACRVMHMICWAQWKMAINSTDTIRQCTYVLTSLKGVIFQVVKPLHDLHL